MTTSHDAPPTNCFSSVFRRLLCAGGLPTHPSSDTPNHPTTHPSSKLQSPSPTRTTIPAGVVAKLMGLDSFPTSTRSTKLSLATIMKSRSTGSLDFLPNFDVIKQPHNPNPLHRRVRTSVSFREVRNHDLGTLDHYHAVGKSEMGLTPKQEKSKDLRKRIEKEREKKITNKKGQSQKVKIMEVPTFLESTSHNNDLRKLDLDHESEMGLAPNQEKSKTLKKRIGNKKGQSQSTKVKIIEEEKEEVLSVRLKCRRKRRDNAGKKKVFDDGFPEEQKKYKSRRRTYNHPLPKMVKHDRIKKQSMLKRRESEYNEEYCMKVLMDVCRLTMAEIEGGVWVDTKTKVDNDLQEIISYEVGQEILQLLVYEMVDELCSSRYGGGDHFVCIS